MKHQKEVSGYVFQDYCVLGLLRMEKRQVEMSWELDLIAEGNKFSLEWSW